MTELILSGNLLMVDPWRSLLEPNLVLRREGFDPFGNSASTTCENLFHLQTVEGRTVGYVPEGLRSRVETLLRRAGEEVFVNDLRKNKDLEPDFKWVDGTGLREGQAEMLAKIIAHYMGVIEAPTGAGKGHIIMQMCLLFPKSRFVIVTPRRTVVRTLAERFVKDPRLADDVGVMMGGHARQPEKRIVVSTSRSMSMTDYQNCDFLVFDECHGAAAPDTARNLALFTNARKYGFSASPVGRGDKADLVLESLFGPFLFSMEYEDGVKAGSIVPIEVHMYKVRGAPVFARTRIGMKHKGIWSNEARNRRIAEAVRKHMPGHILVMCETVEHVMNLKKLLPEFDILFANCSRERYERYVEEGCVSGPMRTDRQNEEIQRKFETGEIKYLISTMIFREGVDVPGLTALCRADGLAGKIPSIQIPGRLSRTGPGKERAYLIDFMDSFDGIMEKMSWARVRTYKKKGWQVLFHEQ